MLQLRNKIAEQERGKGLQGRGGEEAGEKQTHHFCDLRSNILDYADRVRALLLCQLLQILLSLKSL